MKFSTLPSFLNRLFLWLIVAFGATNAVAQQYYPIVARFTQLPPYPVYLADFSNPAQTNLSIQVQQNDREIASRPFRIRIYIEGMGVQIQSTDLVQGESPLTLALGQVYNLPAAQVANYFKQYNLKVSPDQYNRPFNEGAFRFGVEIIDFQTNRPLSGIQWGNPVWVTINEPPVWVIPQNRISVAPQFPQNITFQWAPRHTRVSDVEYEFSITEIIVNPGFEGNIQNLFLAQPAFYKTRTRGLTMNYNVTMPPLIRGRTYAYRVQAFAKRGLEDVGVFRNTGFSEIHYFSYGEAVKPPTNLRVAWNEDLKSLTFNWLGQPDHKNFEAEYREKGSTGEWKKLPLVAASQLNTVNIPGLEGFRNYEFRVSGLDAQNQRATAAPVEITGIAKDEYLKKTEPKFVLEGVVKWAFHASEENVTTDRKNLILTRETSDATFAVQPRKITSSGFDKTKIGSVKHELEGAIVAFYSSDNANVSAENLAANQPQMKLIETVSTDQNGKFAFKNKTFQLLRDLKNLYLVVKYKDDAFSTELIKILLTENTGSVQQVGPVVLLANSLRYSPVFTPDRAASGTVVSPTISGTLSVDNMEEIGLYRLKSVVDKNKYLANEGNATQKTSLTYNKDEYVLVSKFGTSATAAQLFYNKPYNDKFVIRVKQQGRSEVIYPVNPFETAAASTFSEITDYFRYSTPTTKLKGYVARKDLKTPLENVTVKAFGTSLKTDKKGYFEFEIPNSTPLNATLDVSAIDPLNTNNRQSNAFVYQNKDVEQNLFFKAEAITIQGKLVDAAGTGVQGAKVLYKGREAISTADGLFTIIEDGGEISDSVSVVADGFAKTQLKASDFTKNAVTNEQTWLDAVKNKSKLTNAKTDFAAVYKREFTDMDRQPAAVYEIPKVALSNPFKKVRIITYTSEDKRNKLGLRNMKDSATVINTAAVILYDGVSTDIPETGYNFTTQALEVKVKITNKKDAETIYLEEEHTLKLPASNIKKDSVYVLRIKLKPADYLYGVVKDSTLYIDGVDPVTSTRTKRGQALKNLKGVKVSVADGNEATSDENGQFRIMVVKDKETAFEAELDKYNKSVTTVAENDLEKYSKPDNRKDFYVKEKNDLIPKYKTLLGFKVDITNATVHSPQTFQISGTLKLQEGRASNPAVNKLFTAAPATKELTFKDIVVMKGTAADTNAIPVLSQINFVENEAELKVFGYAPVKLEGNPLGEPFIRLQKILGKTGEGKIGGSTMKFTQNKIMTVDFGEMELEEIVPEKEKSFGKFDNAVGKDKAKETKNETDAVKNQKEAKDKAEATANEEKVKTAADALDKARTARIAAASGTPQQKKEAAADVTAAKKEVKSVENAISGPTAVPEKEPLLLSFASLNLEELQDSKQYKIVIKAPANKAKADKQDAVAKTDDKNAAFEKNKIGANENYISFPVGAVSLGTVAGITMNVEKNSGVMKKGGITMKGVMSFPEIWKLKIDKPLVVEKIEIDKDFNLKQAVFTLERGYIYQQSVADAFMLNWTNFQIFNNFKGYGIGGEIKADKENYVIVKSLALSYVNGAFYPNIDLDLPTDGLKTKSLRFKTLGKKSISFKRNIKDGSYELDGSLQIVKDSGESASAVSDSTDKFGRTLSQDAITANRLKATTEADQKKADEAKKASEPAKETAAATGSKSGFELFPLEVHQFTWSTTGKFVVAAKVGKVMAGNFGINIRRIVFSRGDGLQKSEIDKLMLQTESEVAKLSSTTKFNDAQTKYKTDSTLKDGKYESTTKQTGALTKDVQKDRGNVSTANLSVKAVEDKVAKEDPNVSWAFGIAGGVLFDGSPKGLSFDSDVSVVVGDFGKGFSYQFNEIMLKLDAPAVRAMGKVKISTTPEKIGMEGTVDLETAGSKFAASLKFYKYPKGVELGAALQASAYVPLGPVTFTSLGGGFDFNTVDKKYKVFLLGSAIATGSTSKVAELKNINLSVEFDGQKCGSAPVIKGVAELYAKEELYCKTDVELDFCQKRTIAKVNCTKEIIPGSIAEVNALVTISNDGFFAGATVRTDIVGINVNGILALGIECNTASPKMPAEMSNYRSKIPSYLYKGDNVTFTGIYLGFDASKSFESADRMTALGINVLEYKIKAELRAKMYAGVSFTTGNFMIGLNSKLDMEGYVSALGLRLDGKLGMQIAAEGGRTPDMGWNLTASARGKLEIATGDHNNKNCNDYCITCLTCQNRWRWNPIPACSRFSNAFAKVCLEGQFGVSYRERGYDSGWKYIKK